MRKLILLAASCLLFMLSTKAQMQEVTGKIIDSAGNPIAGASIRAKGIRSGTSAGADDSFRIPAPKNGILVISREKRELGSATQTINADQFNKSGTGNALSELNGKAIEVTNSKGETRRVTY